jgi:hypothetical protein
MFLDAFTQLSNAQAVTDADAYSTNTIDLGDVTPKRVVGDGEPLALVITVDTGPAEPAGSLTDTFDFMAVESVNADLSSHTVMAQRRIPGAELVAGALIVINIPPGRPLKRYIGARYELGTGDTITVSAWILPLSFVPRLVSYAKGYVID